MTKHVLDTEPKWESMIYLLVELAQKHEQREYVISELKKIARIADKVRQAQKNKERLVFDFTED